jgi:hypothetical protein
MLAFEALARTEIGDSDAEAITTTAMRNGLAAMLAETGLRWPRQPRERNANCIRARTRKTPTLGRWSRRNRDARSSGVATMSGPLSSAWRSVASPFS